jgi:hypothetical protein
MSENIAVALSVLATVSLVLVAISTWSSRRVTTEQVIEVHEDQGLQIWSKLGDVRGVVEGLGPIYASELSRRRAMATRAGLNIQLFPMIEAWKDI